MIEFGKSLKDAREAKGLTIAQMAETTHLAPTTIAELESEDFSRIAAPIYGRGFVKLYCEAVGLDPKPYTAEFMEIFSGNRDTGIKERPVEPRASETPCEEPCEERPEPPVEKLQPPTEIPPVPTRPLSRQQDLFGEFSEPDEPAPTTPVVESAQPLNMPPPLRTPAPFDLSTTEDIPHPTVAANDHAFSRYAGPLRQLKPIIRSPAWRIGLLAVIALGLLAFLALGIRAVYRATTTDANSALTADEVTVTPKQDSKPAPKEVPSNVPATRRTPQSIPSLYID